MNNYIIDGVLGFSDEIFYKAMKTKYKLLPVFCRENKIDKELLDNISEFWDDIKELTVEDCFAEENVEKRRVLFSSYGPDNIIKNFNFKVIDKQTITKKNIKYVDDKELSYEFEDTYTLYESKDDKLLNCFTGWRKPESIKMVHCKCTTTSRDYYIYVQSDINDAIEAIASTFRVPTTSDNIKEIYRQGDVLLLSVKEFPKNTLRTYPLSREDYLTKLKIES